MPKRTSTRLAKKNQEKTTKNKIKSVTNKKVASKSKRVNKKVKSAKLENKTMDRPIEEIKTSIIDNEDEMPSRSVLTKPDAAISFNDFDLDDDEILSAALLSENSNKNIAEQSTSNIQEHTNNCTELNDEEINHYEKLFLDHFADGSESKKTTSTLSAIQIARCERNRQKALLLRQSKLSKESLESSKSSIKCVKEIASDGGFFIKNDDETSSKKVKVVEELPPVIFGEMSFCLECDRPFLDSYLLTTYDYSACDKCRDSKDKHAVITKTEARETYLLSEVDLTLREPVLKFQVRKNPRHNSWGDMKLYLRLQVEQRAMEIWGTPEALEEEIKQREEKREKAKQVKYKKNMVKLRQEVRSSLYTKKAEGHVHVYGPETECEDNSDDDMWQKICKTCGHTLTFEKM